MTQRISSEFPKRSLNLGQCNVTVTFFSVRTSPPLTFNNMCKLKITFYFGLIDHSNMKVGMKLENLFCGFLSSSFHHV